MLASVQPSYDPKLVEKLEEAQLPWSVVLVITREEYLLVDDFGVGCIQSLSVFV